MLTFTRIEEISLAEQVCLGLRQHNRVSCRVQEVLSTPHFAIREKGELLGWIGYHKRKKRHRILEVRHLTVLPQFRQQGIGREAVNYICDILRNGGHKFCYALIRRENRPSRKLFESLGFAIWRPARVMVYVKQL